MKLSRTFVPLTVVPGANIGAAQATTPVDNLALDISGPGLILAENGAGLEGLCAGSVALSVDIGGPVRAAILY